MLKIDSVNCANDYTAAATVGPVWLSAGGYFALAGQDAWYQLGWKPKGTTDISWTEEVHVPVGNGIIYPGTIAVRFRNYVAGQTAVVSAAISSRDEPVVTIAAGGVATPSSTAMLTGDVNSNGTIAGGTGFTVNHSGTGIYIVSFTNPFSSSPVPVVTPKGAMLPAVVANSASQMTLNFFDTTPSLVDSAFFFLVAPKV